MVAAGELVFVLEVLFPVSRRSPHLAISVKAPNTVISFNIADEIAFLGRSQLFH